MTMQTAPTTALSLHERRHAERGALRRARRAFLLETLTALPLPILVILVPTLLNLIVIPAALIAEMGFGYFRKKRALMGLRLAVGVAIVAAASLAEVKVIDTIFLESLPTAPVTIADYNAAVLQHHPEAYQIGARDSTILIRFSRDRLSLRQFSSELADQTGLRARIGYCGNGGSILFGMSPMGRYVDLQD